ncbi:MAG: hypothetical protein CM1200mP21_07950 [Candidatus Poseidoniales archaeon]|nr:MAG: hypothetical protein CM1200mP21_07950 [Candidatus Poseidoniales archaeon]
MLLQSPLTKGGPVEMFTHTRQILDEAGFWSCLPVRRGGGTILPHEMDIWMRAVLLASTLLMMVATGSRRHGAGCYGKSI